MTSEHSDDNRNTEVGLTYAEWREQLESGNLVGLECSSCGHVTATPKRACGECGGRNLELHDLPETGAVHSETTITVPPVGVEGPYQVAIVDLGDAHLLGRIEGSVEIEDEVAFTTTIEIEGMPAPVFSPLD
ncbi:Zn-ribbon domain-containing OB-fold protein [Haladaptatus cibarius]|uniref:Zn-ribbon domain-containing OB-fold protein n=1 Tax=Haladaptatus cibarius TaxID=453847 RepID=UPI000678E633|nr:zinc ribbon domain-containing protein [Haladaptatus cibarius]